MKVEAITTHNVDRIIVDVLTSPATSYWLKLSLQRAIERDPVDAANDVSLLGSIINARVLQANNSV
ncbi:hypothetical protein LCGC14_3098590 [marine sediment metagenome]|uniref:Uncharacterized protein n=1 Tax=marine sediment metagenome TaxID=412755 RepID=A0A0F8YFV4_9ZZZZ